MNTITKISIREPVPVTVGTLTVWAEEFKASAVKLVNESSLINGEEIITSTSPRSLKIVIKGRIADQPDSIDFLVKANNSLRDTSVYDVDYRGTVFSDCVIQAFTFEGSGSEYINVSLTLITSKNITYGV